MEFVLAILPFVCVVLMILLFRPSFLPSESTRDFKADIMKIYFSTFFWSFKRIYDLFDGDSGIQHEYLYVLAYKAISTMDYYLLYIETCDSKYLYDLYVGISWRIFFPFPKRLTFAQLKEMLSKTPKRRYDDDEYFENHPDYTRNCFNIVRAMLKRVIFNKEDKTPENIQFVRNLLGVDCRYENLLNYYWPWFLYRYFLKCPKN